MTDDTARAALAKVLHEKVTMPGHAYPGAPWKDACDELADQLLEAVVAALPAPARPAGLDDDHEDCLGFCDCYYRGKAEGTRP